MKKLWILPFLLASTQAQAVIAQNCPIQDVALVQRVHDHATQLADAGSVARIFLLKLDWALMDVKFCARQVTLDQYCSTMKTSLTQFIEAGGRPSRSGDFTDLARAVEKLIVLRESCINNQ